MLAEAPPRAELPIVARALGARHASPFGLLNHIVGKPQALRERLGVCRIPSNYFWQEGGVCIGADGNQLSHC